MKYSIRFIIVVLAITICYAWYDKHVALPENGQFVMVCGLHSETLYRQVGDDMTGGEPPSGYMNDNYIVVKIGDGTIEFVTNDQEFFESVIVGETLIGIFNQAGGLSNLFRR